MGLKDPLSPLNSFLLLANGRAGSDGRLQAHEIGWLKSLPARLVVLSACESGVEGYYRGEGMIGFSRSFLSVSVPTVVASVWAVDSSATTKLMVTFHQSLKNNRLTPTKALQQAQLSLIKGSQPQYQDPFYWSAFCVFGGDKTNLN
jgi:CHAT domain-containing protein